MPLELFALTTLTAVKDELGISPTDTSQDILLTRLIHSVSDAIRRFCDREFYYQADIVENYAGYGDPFLVLDRSPLLSIASIAYAGAIIDLIEYQVHNKEAGILYRRNGWIWTAQHQSNITQDKRSGTEEKLYQVTYTAGYVTPDQAANNPLLTRTLPYDLEDACIEIIAIRYNMRGSSHLQRETVGPLTSVFVDGLPKLIMDVLLSYKRWAT